MKKFLSSLLVVTCAFSLSSCAYFSTTPKEPKAIAFLEKAPKVDIRNFFKGDIKGYAIIQDPTGKIINSYNSKMTGKWEDHKGVLQQSFVYNDGKRDSRTWLITVGDDGTFNAVGHDVMDPAKGKQVGNVLQMDYSLGVMVEKQRQKMVYDDVFYMIDEHSMMGTSIMKKGGVVIAKATIFIKKADDHVVKAADNVVKTKE